MGREYTAYDRGYCWDLGAFRYFMRKGYSIHDKNNLDWGLMIAMDKGFHDLMSHMFFNVLPTSNDGKILLSLANANKEKRNKKSASETCEYCEKDGDLIRQIRPLAVWRKNLSRRNGTKGGW